MNAKRKSWQRPALIVLVRGEPAEAVLHACKFTNTPRGLNSPSTQQSHCRLHRTGGCYSTCSKSAAT